MNTFFRTGINRLLVVTAIAGAVLGAVHWLPFSEVEVPVVKVEKAPDQVTLEPGGSLFQTLIVKDEAKYTHVVLYAANEAYTNQRIELSVVDAEMHTLAEGTYISATYLSADDTLRLEIPITWIDAKKGEQLGIVVRHMGGDPLQLKASSGEFEVYRFGDLILNGASINHDIAFSFNQQAFLPLGTQMGVLAGAVFMVGLALVSLLKKEKYQWISAGVLLVLITPLALGGYWFSQGELGIADWDYYFSLHQNYRDIVVKYAQFPFWNPYTCGGTAGLGDPEFPFFTFTFLLEFLFNIPVGVRLAIFESIAVTAIGMLVLGKRLGLSVHAAVLAAVAAAFSSVSLLEITEGHVNVFAAMWIPWIFASWLSAYREKRPVPDSMKTVYRLLIPTKKTVIASMFLALTFYAGGIYLLMYTLLAFIVLPFLISDFWQAIRTTVVSGFWALGLVALKMFPVLLWLRQFPDDAYAGSTTTIRYFGEILFGRHLHGTYLIPNQGSGWHEYGAYIGYVVFALALVGLSQAYKKRVVWMLAVSAVLALLLSTGGPTLEPYFDLMWFFPRSSISRVILFAIIPIALLAGIGVDTFRRSVKKSGLFIAVVLTGFVAIDLMSLTYQLSEQSFVLPPVVPLVSPAPSPIAFTTRRFDQGGQETRNTRAYAATLAGYGTFAYCSVLGPDPMVRTIHDEEQNGIVALSDRTATFELLEWKPNRVAVRVNAPNKTNITLNTNYAEGWRVNGGEAVGIDGRVGAMLHEGSQDVVFEFISPGFKAGLTISTVTVILLILWFMYTTRRK